LPRVPLLGGRTPVERLERFEKAIGARGPIFIKRDDAIPFGFGGNKVRKLEMVMAEALERGADSVITCGGTQSNHARATAAAAAKLGLECHLVLSGGPPSSLTGNARLDEIFGARLHFVAGRADRAPAMTALETRLRDDGKKPYAIPIGASTPLGAAGYALGLLEMIEQGHRPDAIVVASSSGGTQGGLLAGLTLAEVETRIVGISADESEVELRELVEKIEGGLLALLGSRAEPRKAEVRASYVGDGYGVPTEASRDAQALLARTEAILVDHTYTAKALAGLIAISRERCLPEGASVLFWHTGGQVGVLA
jgi:D-cysteine desulfhydrase family pyridoxal phosphate-dependent enzyme